MMSEMSDAARVHATGHFRWSPATAAAVAAAVLLSAVAGQCQAAGGLTVRAVSAHAGMLFTDGEPLDVAAAVGGAGGAASVTYTVTEYDGPWRAEGTVTVPAPADDAASGVATAALPLKLPGRGLYKLKLSAAPAAGAAPGGPAAATATAETHIAVVFSPPARVDPNSPWGIFYTPNAWFDPTNANGPRDAAVQHRLLGAGWSRLNFWAGSAGDVKVTAGPDGKPVVTMDASVWKGYAKALREQGILIFGELAQCPRGLSSRPDETAEEGDAGAMWSRVKPKDYAAWDQYVEKLAREFRDEIGVWEIWNEVNLRGRYWAGTPEELAVHVEHTAAALRRGNPACRVAGCGFVGDTAYGDRMFQLGIGKHIDILTVHYTDERPDEIVRWRGVLDKHGLKLPIWNSEERSEVPIRNLAGGIERSFKFIHVSIGYDDYRPLVRKDWTVLPAGILYSVGAHCIGSGKFAARSSAVPGYDVLVFQRGAEPTTGTGTAAASGVPPRSQSPDAEMVAVFDRNQKTGSVRLFGPTATSARLRVEPLAGGLAPAVVDAWGRSRTLEIAGGQATVSLGGAMFFVTGCRKIEVLAAEGPATAAAGAAGQPLAFEAEDGKWSAGWGANAKEGFSGGRILEIWKPGEPPPGGYWAEIKFAVPKAGKYEVLFSGNDLHRLKDPPGISPFAWRIDDAAEQTPDGTGPVRQGVAGAPEGLSSLGVVELTAGEHTFRLRLTAPRKQPDSNYALWFDAIALQPK
jgi:hypothetical protein